MTKSYNIPLFQSMIQSCLYIHTQNIKSLRFVVSDIRNPPEYLGQGSDISESMILLWYISAGSGNIGQPLPMTQAAVLSVLLDIKGDSLGAYQLQVCMKSRRDAVVSERLRQPSGT